MDILHNVCAVHLEMLSTQAGYHWVHQGDTLSTPDVFSTLGDTMMSEGGYQDECGGYHEYAGWFQYLCSVHRVFHTNSIVFPMTFPHIYHSIPRCTEHPLVYSWYPPPLGVERGKYGFGISLITKFFSKISLSLNFFETLSLSLKKEVDKRIFEPQSETLHRNVAHSTHFIFSTQRVQCYT